MVPDTSTSPGPASAEIRAAAWTATPWALPAAIVDLTGVDARPDLDPERADGLGHRGRTPDGSGRPVEQSQEAVARCVHFAAPEPVQLGAQAIVVVEKQALPRRVADASQCHGRIDDVREEDRRQGPLGLQVGSDPEDPRTRELDRVPGLVAHDPGVVPGRDLERVALDDVELGPIVHHDMQLPGDRVPDVAVLARVRVNGRRNVLGPPPARFPDEAPDRRLVEIDDVDPTPREPADLIGAGEALALKTRHGLILASGVPGCLRARLRPATSNRPCPSHTPLRPWDPSNWEG